MAGKRHNAAVKGWATRRANERARAERARQGHATRRVRREAEAFQAGGFESTAEAGYYRDAPIAVSEPIRELDHLNELLDYFDHIEDFDDWIDYEAETNAGYEED